MAETTDQGKAGSHKGNPGVREVQTDCTQAIGLAEGLSGIVPDTSFDGEEENERSSSGNCARVQLKVLERGGFTAQS